MLIRTRLQQRMNDADENANNIVCVFCCCLIIVILLVAAYWLQHTRNVLTRRWSYSGVSAHNVIYEFVSLLKFEWMHVRGIQMLQVDCFDKKKKNEKSIENLTKHRNGENTKTIQFAWKKNSVRLRTCFAFARRTYRQSENAFFK